MKKIFLYVTAIITIALFSAQSTFAKCETVIYVPSTVCVDHTVTLTLSDAPCNCIDYSTGVEWVITDPSGSTTVTLGTPFSYTFSMTGTYKVCVKWADNCQNQTFYNCYDVVAGKCCSCDMKIGETTSTTDCTDGYIEGSFHLNSGSKKVTGVELSVPFWNYDFNASGCKFDCGTITTGYALGNIVKTSDLAGYYPSFLNCFGTDFSREVDWTFPSPQGIDQTLKYIITIPPTSCHMDYYYCVKVLLHYDDCTICECTFCFKNDEVTCSCDPRGKANNTKSNAATITDETVKIFPNPNGGKFTVQMEKTTDSKVITVVDMTGKIVTKSVISGDLSSFELNNVAAGIYNVVVSGSGKTITKRVVINK
jgi:hypothetical protein